MQRRYPRLRVQFIYLYTSVDLCIPCTGVCGSDHVEALQLCCTRTRTRARTRIRGQGQDQDQDQNQDQDQDQEQDQDQDQDRDQDQDHNRDQDQDQDQAGISGQVTGPARAQVRQVVRSGRWSGQAGRWSGPARGQVRQVVAGRGRQGQAGDQAHFRTPRSSWAPRYFSKVLL